MRKKVSPVVALIAVVVAIGLILIVGYKAYLAPPPQIHGIVNGKPMTDADVAKMADAMSGGQYSIQQKKLKELKAKAAATQHNP